MKDERRREPEDYFVAMIIYLHTDTDAELAEYLMSKTRQADIHRAVAVSYDTYSAAMSALDLGQADWRSSGYDVAAYLVDIAGGGTYFKMSGERWSAEP